MELNDSNRDNYIIAYLNKTISDEDKVKLERWKSSDAEHLTYFNEMKKLWYALEITQKSKQFDTTGAYALFQDQVQTYNAQNDIPEYKVRQKFSINWKAFIKYAAIITICILVSYQFFRYQSPLPVQQGISQIVVPNGSKTDLYLLDGTQVILNAGSKLEVQPGFGQKERVVKLLGEAFFNVAHDSDRPFFVETENVKVKVLGTRFNVNAYDTNEEIQVDLLEGSIEMTVPQSEAIKLQPQQTAVYHVASHSLSLKTQDDHSAIGWIDDTLIFSDETFEQIAYQLERKFDVKINILNNSIKKQRFNGDFVKGETIDQIFNVITSDRRYHYKITKSEIAIY